MKSTHSIPLVLILLAGCPPRSEAAFLTPVNLGSASGFAVLAGSGVSVVNSTTVAGDMGSSPTATISGFGNVALIGVNHAGDAVTAQAKVDLATAYNDAAGRVLPDATFPGGFDLAGLTLNTGLYHDSSSLFLSGTLTLDAQGNSDAVWIFQVGSTLITSSGSAVVLMGGAKANNVFWQIGSSATLGTYSDFAGNLLALESITMNTGATVDGRALAQNGAVTLDGNAITAVSVIPEPSAFWPAFCVSVLGAWRLAVRRPKAGHA